jgi:hypothetical protein
MPCGVMLALHDTHHLAYECGTAQLRRLDLEHYIFHIPHWV